MGYWRMQLHPDDAARSSFHAATCVTKGIIGLDFRKDVGDLRGGHGEIQVGQKDYRLFEAEMQVGDLVLIQTHHYPFALVEIASDYAYVPNAREAYGVWFRHLRLVRNASLYSDYITNPKNWQQITMTDTLAPLRSSDTVSYRLIEEWRGAR